jgi:hypothetical protein
MVDVPSVVSLPDTPAWANVPRLEDGWWPTGGVVNPAADEGIMNWQAQVLAQRTRFLRDQMDGAGIGLATAPLVTDLNAITKEGSYRCASGATGSPLADTMFVVHRAGATTADASQTAFAAASDRILTRRRIGGVWQAWAEMAILGSTAGLIARATNGQSGSRVITAGTGVSVSNGDGAAGNPTIAVDLVTAFGSSIGASGWQRLPSGLIMQWGSLSLSTVQQVVTFPIAFPTGFRSIACSVTEATGNYAFGQCVLPTNVDFTAAIYTGTPGSAPVSNNIACTFHYIALGN